jgi:hypothetical protein
MRIIFIALFMAISSNLVLAMESEFFNVKHYVFYFSSFEIRDIDEQQKPVFSTEGYWAYPILVPDNKLPKSNRFNIWLNSLRTTLKVNKIIREESSSRTEDMKFAIDRCLAISTEKFNPEKSNDQREIERNQSRINYENCLNNLSEDYNLLVRQMMTKQLKLHYKQQEIDYILKYLFMPSNEYNALNFNS